MKDLETQIQFNKIIKTSIFALGVIILAKILGYGYKIVIARYFDAEVYGLFSISMIVIGIIVSIASVGLFEGLVRQIAIFRAKKDSQSIGAIIFASRNFLIGSGVIFSILLFLFAPLLSNAFFHEPRLILFIQILAFAIPLILIANLFLVILRAHEYIITQSILTNLVQNGSRFFALLIFIFIGLNLSSIPLSYLFASIVLAIAAWISLQKLTIKKIKSRDGFFLLKNVLKYSWPLMFVGVLSSIFYWTDSFIIGYLMNIRAVGIYSAAITLISLLGIIPELFIQLLFPVVAFNLSQKNTKLVAHLIRRVAKWILFLNSLLAITYFLFAPFLIKLFFKTEFAEASLSLQVLAIGAIFTSLAAYFATLLSAIAQTKKILFNLLLMVILNIILDILLIRMFGIIGAAIATNISGLILLSMNFIQVKKFYLVYPFDKKSCVLLGVLTLVFGTSFFLRYITSLYLLILVNIGIISTYILILVNLKFFDTEDITLFKKIVKKIRDLIK